MRAKSITPIVLLALATIAACAGCRQHNATDDTHIPRRHGYPRINLYDADYRITDVANVSFLINTGAQIALTDSFTKRTGTWFNITYPRYGAVIHCTITQAPTQKLEAIIDNRAERMALNTGGAYTEVTDFEPQAGHEITAQMLVTPAESVTPLQFLASDGKHTVISGSMTFRTNAHTQPDSVAPIIAAIRDDLTTMLNSLSIK